MAAFGQLSDSLQAVAGNGAGASLLADAARPVPRAGRGRPGTGADAAGLSPGEIVSNAAVLMFGGIETTEGMIANAAWHLLSHPGQLDLVIADPGLLPQAIEESLRLEPAAAVVDRYATRDVVIGGADVSRGDLVSVSVAGAGRDPAAFTDPDRFDVRRGNAGQNLAFARGPHFCLGVHLARLEARAALAAALGQLPGLRLDAEHPAAPRGLVFRKPASLPVLWDTCDRAARGQLANVPCGSDLRPCARPARPAPPRPAPLRPRRPPAARHWKPGSHPRETATRAALSMWWSSATSARPPAPSRAIPRSSSRRMARRWG